MPHEIHLKTSSSRTSPQVSWHLLLRLRFSRLNTLILQLSESPPSGRLRRVHVLPPCRLVSLWKEPGAAIPSETF